MKILNYREILKKYNLKNDTMKEFDLQRVYNFKIYPTDSKIFSDERFVDIDNCSMGGSHWTAFYV